MKGIILAAGMGTRLYPITKSVNKHLLPIYDKPLIFYPITTLMLAGIKDLLVIVNSQDLLLYKKLLGNGSQWGISIKFEIQVSAGGISQGITLAKNFIKKESFALILGDNIFYGVGLGRSINNFVNEVDNGNKNSVIFTYEVSNPEQYGVVSLDANGSIISIDEKPKNSKSNLAITGLYLFNNKAVGYALKLKPSDRGELEITDLLKKYLTDSEISIVKLSLGTAWLDTGNFTAMHDASTFVKIIQDRQDIRIGDPEGAAKINNWI